VRRGGGAWGRFGGKTTWRADSDSCRPARRCTWCTSSRGRLSPQVRCHRHCHRGHARGREHGHRGPCRHAGSVDPPKRAESVCRAAGIALPAVDVLPGIDRDKYEAVIRKAETFLVKRFLSRFPVDSQTTPIVHIVKVSMQHRHARAHHAPCPMPRMPMHSTHATGSTAAGHGQGSGRMRAPAGAGNWSRKAASQSRGGRGCSASRPKRGEERKARLLVHAGALGCPQRAPLPPPSPHPIPTNQP
jgi:hypothetical protein